jgi:uncharacterized protein
MRFWDSSALLPLLVREASSKAVAATYETDPSVVAWWGSQIECASALARLEREDRLAGGGLTVSLGRLADLAAAWHEVQPVAPVRQIAIRLLRVHDLRAADSLQLAAALVAAEGQPATLAFVTLDDRLAIAADREGFPAIQPR